MRQTTLLHIDATQKETIVAKFAKLNEAAQCRDLMQAKCSDQSQSWYFIDFYNPKTKTISRQGADTFAKQVLFMENSVQKDIKKILEEDTIKQRQRPIIIYPMMPLDVMRQKINEATL